MQSTQIYFRISDTHICLYGTWLPTQKCYLWPMMSGFSEFTSSCFLLQIWNSCLSNVSHPCEWSSYKITTAIHYKGCTANHCLCLLSGQAGTRNWLNEVSWRTWGYCGFHWKIWSSSWMDWVLLLQTRLPCLFSSISGPNSEVRPSSTPHLHPSPARPLVSHCAQNISCTQYLFCLGPLILCQVTI